MLPEKTTMIQKPEGAEDLEELKAPEEKPKEVADPVSLDEVEKLANSAEAKTLEKNDSHQILKSRIHEDHEKYADWIRGRVSGYKCRCGNRTKIDQEIWNVNNGVAFISFRTTCPKCRGRVLVIQIQDFLKKNPH